MPSGKVSRVSPNQGKRDMIVRGCEDSQCVRLAAVVSTRYVRCCSSGQGARCMHELLPDDRPGADDEDSRSDLASFSEEDYLVASSRDHRDHRPTDAAVALALQGIWL